MRTRPIVTTLGLLLMASPSLAAPIAGGELLLDPGTQVVTSPVIVHQLEPYDPLPQKHTAYALPTTSGVFVESGTSGCPAVDPKASWAYSYTRADDFGNGTFGAGYDVLARVSGQAGTTAAGDRADALGRARALATVFGDSRTLARVEGKASLKNSLGTSSIVVNVLGTDLYSRSVSGNLTDNKSWSKTFYSASKTIWFGPIPVSFKGSVKGNLGISYGAGYAASTFNLNTRPWMNAVATGSAGVDVLFASAGVAGSLTLLELALPSSANLAMSSTGATWGIQSDLTLKSLAGKITAYAELFGERWERTIASWGAPISKSFQVVRLSGCSSPIVRPRCGDNVCQSWVESPTSCSRDCGAPPPPPSPCELYPWKCGDEVP